MYKKIFLARIILLIYAIFGLEIEVENFLVSGLHVLSVEVKT